MATKKTVYGYVEISKSRSDKKPFKIRIIAKNGEQVGSSQLLTTRLNAKKNILSHLHIFQGTKILVNDKTGKEEKHFDLLSDGYENQIQ